MTIQKLTALHREMALTLMRDKSFRSDDKLQERADQFITATRHMLCAWILIEATEDQISDVVDHAEQFAVLNGIELE